MTIEKLLSRLITQNNYTKNYSTECYTAADNGCEKLSHWQPSEGPERNSVFRSLYVCFYLREHIACYILSQRLQINWCENEIKTTTRAPQASKFYPIVYFSLVVVHIDAFQYIIIYWNEMREKKYFRLSVWVYTKYMYNYERVFDIKKVIFCTWNLSRSLPHSCVCNFCFTFDSRMRDSAMNTQKRQPGPMHLYKSIRDIFTLLCFHSFFCTWNHLHPKQQHTDSECVHVRKGKRNLHDLSIKPSCLWRVSWMSIFYNSLQLLAVSKRNDLKRVIRKANWNCSWHLQMLLFFSVFGADQSSRDSTRGSKIQKAFVMRLWSGSTDFATHGYGKEEDVGNSCGVTRCRQQSKVQRRSLSITLFTLKFLINICCQNFARSNESLTFVNFAELVIWSAILSRNAQ